MNSYLLRFHYIEKKDGPVKRGRTIVQANDTTEAHQQAVNKIATKIYHFNFYECSLIERGNPNEHQHPQR